MGRLEGPEFREWIEAADRAQAEAFACLARPIRHGQVARVEHGILFSTGVPSQTLNGVNVTKPPRDPAAAVFAAEEFGAGLGVGWSLTGRQEVLAGMMEAIVSAGLKQIDSEPGMILDELRNETPAAPKGLVIERAADLAGIRNCFLTMAAGYEIPPAALLPLLQNRVLYAYLADPALNFHVGYVDGNPVACSVGLAAERVSYVFIVSTLPAFRRRGFGEALSWSAVHAGRERGGRVSYLRATEAGRPVYEKMGYREVTRHVSYAKSTVHGLSKVRLILRFIRWTIQFKVAGPRVARRK